LVNKFIGVRPVRAGPLRYFFYMIRLHEDKSVSIFLFIIIVLFGFIPFLAWFTGRYSAFCYKKMVGDRLEAADEILHTGRVPGSWRLQQLEKIAASGGGVGKIADGLLERWYMGRLRNLVRYVAKTTLINGERRAECVRELRRTEKAWAEIPPWTEEA
jgi:hypothetical protein